MSKSTAKPIPDGMRSLTPHLCIAGAADAIEFYKKAFSAVEVTRLPGPNGRLMHAMLRIGGSGLGPVSFHTAIATLNAAI